MRAPGFDGDTAPSADNSLQWLASRIVAHERFAEAAVRFWWPAIMGFEVAVPPEDERDPSFAGMLLASSAQSAEVSRLADQFRRGMHGGQPYNLKALLVEIALSPWFRAESSSNVDSTRATALLDAGAKRLLTPEELARKTESLTGVGWKREIRRESGVGGHLDRLEYGLSYGGIDSDGITERSRDVTPLMASGRSGSRTRVELSDCL